MMKYSLSGLPRAKRDRDEMKLFEYQAKEIFKRAGIPVPRSIRIIRPENYPSGEGEINRQVTSAGEELGLPLVIKSQVLMGGRGKAGLIPFIREAGQLVPAIHRLFSHEIPVPSVLAESAVSIDREIYLAITADPPSGRALILASAEGGVEIEELAVRRPEAIARVMVDIERGIMPFQIRFLIKALGLENQGASDFKAVIQKLWKVFTGMDCELAEINPLFLTREGNLIAGDGKISIDDNSLGRHPDYRAGRDYYESDAAYEAAEDGIPYLQFEGDISLMCAGAGLTTTVYDLVIDAGGSVANYLEFGGPNYMKARRAMELCLKNKSSVILMVTFGTIARADVMAEGIVSAIRELKPDRPIVTCIRGTNEEAAVKILEEAGLEAIFDTEVAVRRAVELSAGASS
jgi:succinyl-CoA synthetase beta subunit